MPQDPKLYFENRRRATQYCNKNHGREIPRSEEYDAAFTAYLDGMNDAFSQAVKFLESKAHFMASGRIFTELMKNHFGVKHG